MLRHELMQHCPRWESCSAPVCPLDPLWRKVPHLEGERVCLFLTEYGKRDGEARIRASLSSELADKVAEAHSELYLEPDGSVTGRGRIRAVLKQAAVTGSRIENGRRLRTEAA